MIRYEFEISEKLRSYYNAETTLDEWQAAGEPCLDVKFIASEKTGSFTVSFWDLISDDDVRDAGTDAISIDDWTEEELLNRFDELLEIENYVENRFLSNSSEEDDDEEIIKMAMNEVDYDDSAAYMVELLTDENWSTYKMFEDICSHYLDGNEDVRKGIDLAFSSLTGYGLTTAAKILIMKAKKSKEGVA